MHTITSIMCIFFFFFGKSEMSNKKIAVIVKLFNAIT